MKTISFWISNHIYNLHWSICKMLCHKLFSSYIWKQTTIFKIWSIFLFVERCVLVIKLVAAKVICQYMFFFTLSTKHQHFNEVWDSSFHYAFVRVIHFISDNMFLRFSFGVTKKMFLPAYLFTILQQNWKKLNKQTFKVGPYSAFLWLMLCFFSWNR